MRNTVAAAAALALVLAFGGYAGADIGGAGGDVGAMGGIGGPGGGVGGPGGGIGGPGGGSGGPGGGVGGPGGGVGGPGGGIGGPGGMGGPMECIMDCRALRGECHDACTAEFRDCVRIAKTEMRSCRHGCRADFGRGTEDFAICVGTCRDEVLAVAAEQCGQLRGECKPECRPGNCRRECRPGGGVVDPTTRECLRGCIVDLHDCALGGKQEMRECLQPCLALEPGEQREGCFRACANSVGESHLACREAFGECRVTCLDGPPTTMVP